MASTVMPTTTSPEECPLGWVDGGHMGCFKFLTNDVKLSWVEAVVACENLDSFLAEPVTAEQLEFVTSMAYIEEGFTGVQGWWVGLTDLGHEGQWTWQHSQKGASIDAWASSCPDTSSHNTLDCAALVSVSVNPLRQYDALYRDYPCAERVHGIKVTPICQRGGSNILTTTTIPDTTTRLPSCPSGWTTYDSQYGTRKCFKSFTSEKTASSAESYCVNYCGGHLASVHSQDEMDFITNSFYASHQHDVWIGGYSSVGKWKWRDGTIFDFADWMTGQPDGQDAIELDWDRTSTKAWRDISGGNNFAYICQLIM